MGGHDANQRKEARRRSTCIGMRLPYSMLFILFWHFSLFYQFSMIILVNMPLRRMIQGVSTVQTTKLNSERKRVHHGHPSSISTSSSITHHPLCQNYLNLIVLWSQGHSSRIQTLSSLAPKPLLSAATTISSSLEILTSLRHTLFSAINILGPCKCKVWWRQIIKTAKIFYLKMQFLINANEIPSPLQSTSQYSKPFYSFERKLAKKYFEKWFL